MYFRKFLALMICAISIPGDALAQGSQRYQSYPDHNTAFINHMWALDMWLLMSMAILLIGAISCAWTDIIREKASAEETQLHRQARLMREMTAHQDNHTDMMRSEIDRTRTYGEYRERPEIAEHERRIRELRNKLR